MTLIVSVEGDDRSHVDLEYKHHTLTQKAGPGLSTPPIQKVTLQSQWATDWRRQDGLFGSELCSTKLDSHREQDVRKQGVRVPFPSHTHTSKGHVIPGIPLFLLPVVCFWWIDADLYFMGLLSRHFLWYCAHWPTSCFDPVKRVGSQRPGLLVLIQMQKSKTEPQCANQFCSQPPWWHPG